MHRSARGWSVKSFEQSNGLYETIPLPFVTFWFEQQCRGCWMLQTCSICRNRKLPERAGTYHIIFVYNDHKHNIESNEVGTSTQLSPSCPTSRYNHTTPPCSNVVMFLPHLSADIVSYHLKCFLFTLICLIVQALYDMTSHKLQQKLFYLFCTPEGILFDMWKVLRDHPGGKFWNRVMSPLPHFTIDLCT